MQECPATFSLFPWRFTFRALQSVHFPVGKSGNVLRGGFGTIFRRVASKESYRRVFEPGGSGPSGLFDWPRPFVFRASHLDGKWIQAGEDFHFDLHVFLIADPALASFVLAFTELGREGIGPRRGRAELISVTQIGSSAALAEAPPAPMTLSLSPIPAARIMVQFLTPTELKGEEGILRRPEFPVLFGRARDRVATLRSLYGEGPLSVDFRGMGERSRHVELAKWAWQEVPAERTSSRTGQTHSIGGFVGEAEYSGNLSEFLPYLKAAEWTGVGRQTVWGKGAIRVLHC